MLDKSTKKKEYRMCNIAIRKAGMKQDDALAVCRAHRGLPVGFLLLRYSV